MSNVGLTGFVTLTRREILRFLRRPRNTFIPPFVTNVLYFAVFGVVLGERVGTMQFDGLTVEYITFILPGLVVLGAISNAFENSSFSIFHGRWNRYIEETLTSPMSYSRMVAAYIVSGAVRGLLVGTLIAVIGTFFTSVGVAKPFYLLAFALVITLLFSSIGVVGGLWAEDWDNLTMMNQFLVRPLVFFGGVFYTVNSLPPGIFRDITLLNPMVYMVNGIRYGFLGASEVNPNLSLAVLSGLTVVFMLVDAYLFRRGYGLTD
ncbi:ABC-2 type transport system permease protein [Haladaptatus litoreus]|uniref:ABC-2 type transport system permease protein n=1 Tax=Haladaptatus litoreus TaxID=553468 RepID=A0A1N6WDT3_9EURY|nr:ABC transporter permease [Haladaptatus litoreus]SIQ88115.1 ABC-2 type transport system permease protein [Haladaptatus litoreus]